MAQIKSNKAQCLKCMQIIESVHRHDFTSCTCGNIAVDGGKEYIRRVGDIHGEGTTWKELSEHEQFR